MKLVPILFSALFLLTSCFLQKNKNHARTSEFSEKNGSGAMILRFAEGSHATHPRSSVVLPLRESSQAWRKSEAATMSTLPRMSLSERP